MHLKLNKMTREQVYAALDSEREYQDFRWQNPEHANHSIEEWIVYMEAYLNKVKHDCTFVEGRSNSSKEVTDGMRKVVALGVACLEQNGCENRVFRPELV